MSRSCTVRRRAAAAVLAATAAIALAPSVVAQTSGLPSGGGAIQPAPGRTYSPEQLGAVSSAQRYMITSSANDRGAFLWIINSIEKKVTLCEKPSAATDFTCTKKSLP